MSDPWDSFPFEYVGTGYFRREGVPKGVNAADWAKKHANGIGILHGMEAINHVYARVRERMTNLENSLEVLDGTWCAENQEAGRGSCGACRMCYQITIRKLVSALTLARKQLESSAAPFYTGCVAICDALLEAPNWAHPPESKEEPDLET